MMRFKPEDFLVEEIPLYEPTKEGLHTYFAIRKRGLTTYEAIKKIASILQVNPKNIGYAGLKDKHAITTQVLSVEGITPEQVLKIEVPSIQVLWAERHPHKIRIGHLSGNSFTINLRDIPNENYTEIVEKFEKLATEGVPNRYGKQRFGNKQDTHLIGKALLKRNWEQALEYILTEDIKQNSRTLKKIELEKSRNSLERAVMCVHHRLRKLYLSAYQAYLFNRILEIRFPHIGNLLDGDIAFKHINSAQFNVENASVEQPRADEFEISPTGPIFGYKMMQPTGKVKKLEMELLSEEGVTSETFHKVVGIRLPGTRRPLRIKMEFPQIHPIDDGVRLCFTLRSGGYATVVLDELFRPTI